MPAGLKHLGPVQGGRLQAGQGEGGAQGREEQQGLALSPGTDRTL